MDECVVEGGKDVRDAEHIFARCNLRPEDGHLFWLPDFLGRLWVA